MQSNVLLSYSAQSSRGLLCFIRSVQAAASFPALASSSPAWGSSVVGERATRVGFQRPEFLLEHGMIDAIVPRKELRAKLGQILGLVR